MDGLIFDTEKMLVHFWHEAAAEYGFDMQQQHSIAIRSTSPENAEKILHSFFGNDFDYYKIRRRRRELMNEYIKNNGLPVKHGVFKILEFAKKNGLKTAVATATDAQRTRWYLEKENLIGYFDRIATVHMVKKGKPEPDIYLKAADMLCIRADNAAAFEDSPNGIISAYKAGCTTFMIPDLTEPDENLKKYINYIRPTLSAACDTLQQLIKEKRGVLL